jgi:hypothetical protein
MARKEIDNPTSSHGEQEWWYDDIQPNFVEATTSEVENILNGETTAEVKNAGTVGDKPLIVLITGRACGVYR